MATRRQYAGAAVQTTITSSLSAVATTIDIASTTGWPSGATPYFVVISPGTTSEEKCLATRASSTLTLTRGQDGTTGQSHSSGAVIYLVFTATDADESNEIAAAITTKGDLISRSSSAPARLAVGANGQVLLADSTTTTGLAWGASVSSSTLKFRSGQYYSVPHRSQGASSRTLNRTQFYPIYIPQSLTVDRIGISVALGPTSPTDTARLGIYNDTNGIPSTVVLDAGTVSVAGTPNTLGQFEITISQALGVGWYWLAANVQSSTAVGHSYYYPVDIDMGHLPSVRFVTAQGNNGYYEDSISGAFATAVTLVLTTSGGAGPGAWVRVA